MCSHAIQKIAHNSWKKSYGQQGTFYFSTCVVFGHFIFPLFCFLSFPRFLASLPLSVYMKPQLELQMKIWKRNMKTAYVITPIELQYDVLQITITTTTRQLSVLSPSFSFSSTSIIKQRTWLLKKEKTLTVVEEVFCTVFFVACAFKGDPGEVWLKSN